LVVRETAQPLCCQPPLVIGSKPIDGGNYIFDEETRPRFLEQEPHAERYMHPFVGSEEFINGSQRRILYLQNASPHELRAMPEVVRRIAKAQNAGSTCRSGG